MTALSNAYAMQPSFDPSTFPGYQIVQVEKAPRYPPGPGMPGGGEQTQPQQQQQQQWEQQRWEQQQRELEQQLQQDLAKQLRSGRQPQQNKEERQKRSAEQMQHWLDYELYPLEPIDRMTWNGIRVDPGFFTFVWHVDTPEVSDFIAQENIHIKEVADTINEGKNLTRDQQRYVQRVGKEAAIKAWILRDVKGCTSKKSGDHLKKYSR